MSVPSDRTGCEAPVIRAIVTVAIAEAIAMVAAKDLGRRPKTSRFIVDRIDGVDRFVILPYTPNTSKKASSSS